MFGLETLDILIGLTTIYLTFAVACTACVEAVSAMSGLRHKNLQKALGEFLDGDVDENKKFIAAFNAHPLVSTLSQTNGKGPSYIPAEIVGKVVEAIVMAKPGVRDLDGALSELPASRTKDLLLYLHDEAATGIVAFREQVAAQFDATMERASGWFKRKTQLLTFIVSAILVVGLNVDTISIVEALASNPQARAALVEIAQQRLEAQQDQCNTEQQGGLESDPGKSLDECLKDARAALDQAMRTLDTAALPLGWGHTGMQDASTESTIGAVDVLTKVLGLAASIFAISLGSPFWFNVLDRFNAVRTTGARQKTPLDR